MVYKKYIYKNGRKHGPYYYESYREGDNIKKRYLGTSYSKQRNYLFYLIIAFALVIGANFLYYGFTGHTLIEDISENLENGDSVDDISEESSLVDEELPEVVEGDSDIISEEDMLEDSNESIIEDINESVVEEDLNISVNSSDIDEVINSSLVEDEINVTLDENVSIESNVSEINSTEVNSSIVNLNGSEITIETKRYNIVLNRPVKWIKEINIEELGNVSEIDIEIPKEAVDLKIKTGFEAAEAVEDVEEFNRAIESSNNISEIVDSGITGFALREIAGEESFLEKIMDFIFRFVLTGRVISEEDIAGESILVGEESKVVEVGEIVDLESESQIVVEYYTEAPTAIEEDTESGKIVVIRGPDDAGYEDILSFAEVNGIVRVEDKDSIIVFWKDNASEMDFEVYDLDFDGFIDYVEWITPHLSEQTFEIILISDALHLNENRVFIENVYSNVSQRDNVTSSIPSGHYIRVSFEKNLSSAKDISVYASGSGGNVEVYVKDGNDLLSIFENISEDRKYQIFLTNLTGEMDIFDLKVLGSSVFFDYILDPVANDSLNTIYQCGSIDSPGVYTLNISISTSSSCIFVNSSNVTIDGLGRILDGEDTAIYGINISNFRNVTIKNLNITNFAKGIQFGSASSDSIDVVILNNSFTSNALGIEIIQGTIRSSIINNSIKANSQSGIDLTTNTDAQFGINMTGNVIDSNSQYGARLYLLADSLIQNNSFSSNTLSGIYLQADVIRTNITNNRIYANVGNGIYSVSSYSNNFEGNNISSNSLEGIYLLSERWSNLSNNFVYANGDNSPSFKDGIVLEQSMNISLLSNTILDNFDDGINLKTNSKRINVSWNNISLNNGKGILVQGASEWNNFIGNRVFNNSGDGIDLDTNYNNVTYNHILQNGDCGAGNGDGISNNGGDNNTFVNNSVDLNCDDGIELDNTAVSNQVLNNSISSNYDEGIHVQLNSVYNNISWNYLNNQRDHGIRVRNSSNSNVITFNTINGSGRAPADKGDGIFILSNLNLVYNNTITYGSDDAIHLENATGNLISNNSIKNNIDKAINLIVSHYNNISFNYATYNSHGYVLQDNSSNNSFIGDFASNNSLQGIYVKSSLERGNVFNNTLAYCNYGDYDIYDRDNSSILNSTCGSYNRGTCDSPSPATCTLSCNFGITSTTLLSNDSACLSSAYNITGNNVLFDCGNHSIKGSNQANKGIVGINVRNLTIINCFVSAFEEGIYLINATNVTISNLTLTLGEVGVRAQNSSFINVINVTFIGNEDGVQFDNVSYGNILNSTFDGNEDDGVQFELRSNNNTIYGNNFTNQLDNAVKLQSDSINNTLAGNFYGNNSIDVLLEPNSLIEYNFSGLKLEVRDSDLVGIRWGDSLSFNRSSLSGLIDFAVNSVSVNSSIVNALNSTANVTFFNTNSFASGIINRYPLYDGNACPSSICTELSDSDTYIFRTTRFSTYSLGYTTSTPSAGGGSSGSGSGVSSNQSNLVGEEVEDDEEKSLVFLSCNPQWECSEWGECENGFISRNCVDKNLCQGALKPEDKLSCYCQPNYQCSEWGECKSKDRVSDVLKGNVNLNGLRERDCADLNNCALDYQDYESCALGDKLNFENRGKVDFADKIFGFDNGERVVEIDIKVDKIGRKLDIVFVRNSTIDVSGCFNKIRDEGEEGVDCGGSCQKCSEDNLGFIDRLNAFLERVILHKLFLSICVIVLAVLFLIVIYFDFIKSLKVVFKKFSFFKMK